MFVATMISSIPGIAEERAIYKLQDDPRVTRVGRLLRTTSLDEVPQLINVLMGDMSLVGPRPPLEYEVAKYEPWQVERLTVRPGITGLWQVSGRNRLTYREMCEIDIRYARSWTFAGDLKIALRTPWAMWVDRGGAE
jgi:lipopolysaccharide/colanic/teichoic acid biosynthesis glycosyltransferase